MQQTQKHSLSEWVNASATQEMNVIKEDAYDFSD